MNMDTVYNNNIRICRCHICFDRFLLWTENKIKINPPHAVIGILLQTSFNRRGSFPVHNIIIFSRYYTMCDRPDNADIYIIIIIPSRIHIHSTTTTGIIIIICHWH